jgi:tetratricopeptide (TPR) repeat protein
MRPSSHLRTSLCTGLAVVGLAVVGRAEADPSREAQAHLERAMSLHADARYTEALTELTTAYALDPQPEILYAIAQTHVQLGDCAQAALFYQRFLSTDPAAVAAAAAREAMTACAATVGASGARGGSGTEPGAQPPAEPTAPATTEPPSTAAPIVDRPTAARRDRWYRDPVGLALVGGGVGLGVVGLVTYGTARSKIDRAATAPSYSQYVENLADARRLRVSAIALGAVGALAVGIGAVHLWRHRGHATELAIAPVEGGGVLSLGGPF